MAKINPLQFGMMGAAVGALGYALNENTRQMLEQAEMRKEQRLAEIRDELAQRGEARANTEWERRNGIENEQAVARDERVAQRQFELQDDSQAFQSGEKDKDRQHDLKLIGVREDSEGRLIDRRTGAQINEDEFRERQRRAGVVFDTEYARLRGPKNPNGSDQKGIVGDDGKTYPYGEPLPAGVKPAGGYGVSWAPSASKSQAPGGVRRRGGVGTEAMPSAGSNSLARPKTQQEYSSLPSGTSYVAPDGTIRVKP